MFMQNQAKGVVVEPKQLLRQSAFHPPPHHMRQPSLLQHKVNDFTPNSSYMDVRSSKVASGQSQMKMPGKNLGKRQQQIAGLSIIKL